MNNYSENDMSDKVDAFSEARPPSLKERGRVEAQNTNWNHAKKLPGLQIAGKQVLIRLFCRFISWKRMAILHK